MAARAQLTPCRTTLKTCFITGGSKGIGYEAARQLALILPDDGRIYLTSRDAGRGAKAVASLAAATGKPESLFAALELDTEDPLSLKNAVDALPVLDAFIMNASDPSAKGQGAHGVAACVNQSLDVRCSSRT